MSDEALANALMALAEAEGMQPEQLLKEMIRERIGGAAALPAHQPQQLPQPPQQQPQQQPQVIDRTPAPQQQPLTESDAMAYERWLAEESQPTGVLGDAGMSSGGVFGQGVVASTAWDPAAHHRQVALERAAPALGAQATELLAARLAARLQPAPVAPQLPPHQQHVRYYQSVTMYEGPAGQMPPAPSHPQFAPQQPQPQYRPMAAPQHRPQLPQAHYPVRQLPSRRR